MTNAEICKLLRMAHDALSISSMPPKREWVGLTDEERDECLGNYITAEGRARAIEAKLKEKNGYA